MLLLRLYLLIGLIAHKVIWEVLKRRQESRGVSTDRASPVGSSSNWILRLVKGVKVVILLAIVAQTLLPEILPISADSLLLRVAGVSIYTAGLLMALSGRLKLGSNWSDIEAAKVLSEQKLVSRGIYRFIRHPIYVGDLLLLVGLELSLNSWLVLGALLLFPIVLWQAVQEEKKLVHALPGYDLYCRQTKRFIPFVL